MTKFEQAIAEALAPVIYSGGGAQAVADKVAPRVARAMDALIDFAVEESGRSWNERGWEQVREIGLAALREAK